MPVEERTDLHQERDSLGKSGDCLNWLFDGPDMFHAVNAEPVAFLNLAWREVSGRLDGQGWAAHLTSRSSCEGLQDVSDGRAEYLGPMETHLGRGT